MEKRFERFKADLKVLVDNGIHLWNAIRNEQIPDVIEEHFNSVLKLDYAKFSASLPDFKGSYQPWYGQALAMVRLLMPERVSDFVRLYEVPKGRKVVTRETYVIEDYLNGVEVLGFDGEVVIGPKDALGVFELQLNILKSVSSRFETTLFDIRERIQADIFDAELDSAEVLMKSGHFRSAGVICGVVLLKHLAQVGANHGLKPLKKAAKVSDYNEALQKAGVYDFPTFRFISVLADLHLLCLKEKKREPVSDELGDLLGGTDKVIKTVF